MNLLTVLLSVVIAAQATPEPRAADLVGPLTRTYGDCVASSARRLEPSGETADSVARSSLVACAKERDEVRFMVKVVSRQDGRDEDFAQEVARRVMEGFDARITADTVLLVTTIRADRLR